MSLTAEKVAAKVPAVTLGFWALKIIATTLGETAGDAVTMTLNWGYLAGSLLFALAFALAVWFQVRAKHFHPGLYWATIVATTTLGTTMADFADRSLGIGYAGGSTLLALLLALSFFVWRRSVGDLSVASIRGVRSESFYWTAILFSQTLGTALGDWTSDSAGLGYRGSALLFGGLLLLLALLYFFSRVSHTALFWGAFVLTRPLGAVLGDLLDKPIDHGGLAFGRFSASGALILTFLLGVFLLPQRAAERSH